MLNRRILRIKAMQSIYAFKQAHQSNFHVTEDYIVETFAPDLTAPEVQDRAALDQKKKEALKLFAGSFPEGKYKEAEGASPEARTTVLHALNIYHNQVKKDLEHYRKVMVTEAENVYNLYLQVLLLLVELSDAVLDEEKEKSRRHIKPLPASPEELRLAANPVIETIRKSGALEKELIRRGVSWSGNRDFVKAFYRDVLKKDEAYIAYQQAPSVSFEDHHKIVMHIFKALILKEESAVAFFEEEDIKWEENKDIIKSMAGKTIKSVTEEDPDALELAQLSANWEDDKEFFIDLYDLTLKDDLKYEGIIAGKVKNWDFDRIAAIDKIILKMALCEMFNFPSIPVKVTINEYIDLSKQYSTPKSKQFVNGLLDVMAAELTESGQIRKSGRGLIDNK
jgi:N utilization substance protein B